MKVKPAKAAKGRADRLFSLIVRSAGRCARCGESDYTKLQCAHIVSRRYSATRCDFTNAVAMCSKCHLRLTNEPYEHVAFFTEYLGADEYARVRQQAYDGVNVKVDWVARAEELRVIARAKGLA